MDQKPATIGSGASYGCVPILVSNIANAFAFSVFNVFGRFCAVGAFWAIGCATSSPPDSAADAGRVEVHAAASPSSSERYCAWYGDVREGVLYFGQAAFWSAMRAGGGDPRADLNNPGPRWIGRFDLSVEKHLAPLDAGAPGAHSGVWDVLPHPNGLVYFTTFFESAGVVDPADGSVRFFTDAGLGLNELALGPNDEILVTRYGDGSESGSGALVILDREGHLLAEHPLAAAPGHSLSPKTPAYDPVRGEVWLTTDLLRAGAPVETSPGEAHPTVVLDLDGRETRRISNLEVQFVRFAADGSGYLAVVDPGLELIHLAASNTERNLDRAERVVLDPDFPTSLDFVQDIQIAPDGRVVATRWSGRVHVIEPAADGAGFESHASTQLPRPDHEGLYYSAALERDRLCVTYCAAVQIVCAPAPGPSAPLR